MIDDNMDSNQNLSQWLELRIPYDTKARNALVEKRCQAYVQHDKTLKIVDLGAGTGANCRYYMNCFRQDQEWYLVEQNQALLDIAIEHLKSWSQKHKYQLKAQPYKLQMTNNSHRISIIFLTDSILNIHKIIDLNKVNLIIGNAVFDLFSFNQLQELLGKLQKYRLPLLTTLNYMGMTFIPETDEDLFFIDYYHRHMQRPQSFGHCMGADSGSQIFQLMQTLEMELIYGKSVWEIDSTDQIFLSLLIKFMEDFIPDVMEPEQISRFQHWLVEKKQMIARKHLGCHIFHRDFFGYWN